MRPNHRAKAVLSKVLLFGLHGTEMFLGVPWWLSGLRIWCCHCSSLCHCCGTGSVPDLGTSAKKREMFLNDVALSSGVIHLGPRERRRWSGCCSLVRLLTQEAHANVAAVGTFSSSSICTCISSCFFFSLVDSSVCLPSLWLKRGRGALDLPASTWFLMTAQRDVWWHRALVPPQHGCVRGDGRGKGTSWEKHEKHIPSPPLPNDMLLSKHRPSSLSLCICSMGRECRLQKVVQRIYGIKSVRTLYQLWHTGEKKKAVTVVVATQLEEDCSSKEPKLSSLVSPPMPNQQFVTNRSKLCSLWANGCLYENMEANGQSQVKNNFHETLLWERSPVLTLLEANNNKSYFSRKKKKRKKERKKKERKKKAKKKPKKKKKL